jgi:hypothetical protein
MIREGEDLLGRRFAPKERKPGKRNAQKARKFIFNCNHS